MLRSAGNFERGTAAVFAAPPIIDTQVFARVPDELRQHRDPRHQSGVPRDCFIEGPSFDRDGNLYVSCRNDGTIHRVSPDGRSMQWVEGMGIATGLAFDKAGSLYVGDRSGTIFKIAPDREIFVFATLEPSMAAYHLAFSPAGELFVTGPTTSSFDRVYRISPAGEVTVFFRGLGRPQGLAFDRRGNLYVAGSLAGKRGIVRLTPRAEAELVLSGSNIVGLALLPSHRALITTNNALYTLDWDVEGFPMGS